MSPLTHVVAFKIKPSLDVQGQKDVFDHFLSLKDACKRDGKTYIKSIIGGPQTSIEPFHRDMTMTFVVTFDSSSDRDYYVKEDPAHAAFASKAIASVDEVVVFDFESAENGWPASK